MKLCCIIHSLGIGGMERVMTILLREFASYEEIDVHLILIGRNREVLWEIPSSVKIHKPKWIFNNWKRKRHTIKTLGFIRSTVKNIQPDGILSFGEMWNNLVLLSLAGLSFPIYVSDRSKPNKDLGRIQNSLRKHLYPSAAGYIAQTEKAAKVAKLKAWNSNVTVIGNPILPIEPGSHDKNVVLTVGRLITTKNIDRLMEMFHDVNNSANWKLVVVGGNAKRKHLLEDYKKQVEENGWVDHMQLVGEKKEVTRFYQSAKIFAFTSTSEGFPNSLAEAMAAGCACIAYDCIAGPSDIIDDGVNGFLVPVGDEQQYKEKLQHLMQDEKLREYFGQAAQEKMKKFEYSSIAKKYIKFIIQKIGVHASQSKT